MAWDQREVELERQLDLHDRRQNEILSTAQKVCKLIVLVVYVLIVVISVKIRLSVFFLLQFEATGSVPDYSLPLPQQLEQALRKIREHAQIVLEMRATCKSFEEVIGLVS